MRKTTHRGSYSEYKFLYAIKKDIGLKDKNTKNVEPESHLKSNMLLVYSTGVILLKAETRDRLAIVGVKSNRFLCMDAGGTLFTSVSICFKQASWFS